MPSLRQIVPSPIKTAVRSVTLRYRQASASDRSLPDFIIIGAQRAGTSSLYYYLGQHPDLIPSFVKEVHFFDGGLNPRVDNFKAGQAWYRAHFPLRKEMGPAQKTFEASPLYLFNPLAPKRILELLPQAKLIAILRNPVERAISHYFHERKLGFEALPIMEALQTEAKRVGPALDRQDYKDVAFIHSTYKTRGHYAEQIARYLACFPRSSILLISSEKFFLEPRASLQHVFEFVGVDPAFRAEDLEPRNAGNNRSAVGTEVYEYLDDYFRPHNRSLQELTGEAYGW
jgi:sulfotransferase family protein